LSNRIFGNYWRFPTLWHRLLQVRFHEYDSSFLISAGDVAELVKAIFSGREHHEAVKTARCIRDRVRHHLGTSVAGHTAN
jgi:hypothetical protein